MIKIHNLATGAVLESPEECPIRAVQRATANDLKLDIEFSDGVLQFDKHPSLRVDKGAKSVCCGDWAAAYVPQALTYEVSCSEYCNDAPSTITLNPKQFKFRVAKVADALKTIGMDYAKAFFETGVYEEDREEPYGYEPSIKIYSNGNVQLLWKHKHNGEEYWIGIPAKDIFQ